MNGNLYKFNFTLFKLTKKLFLVKNCVSIKHKNCCSKIHYISNSKHQQTNLGTKL